MQSRLSRRRETRHDAAMPETAPIATPDRQPTWRAARLAYREPRRAGASYAMPLLLVFVLSIMFASPSVACIGERQALPQTIDQYMAQVRLTDGETVKIKELRQVIVERNAQGDRKGALAAEAEAMTLLGYKFDMARGGGCGGWSRIK
jgi:hypothetical protein